MKLAGIGTFLIASTAVLALAAGQEAKKAAAGIKVGDEAPARAVALTGIDGKSVTIDGMKGKTGTLVVFSCVGCPYVKAWDDRLAEIGNSLKEKGIGVVVINSNDPNQSKGDTLQAMADQSKAKKYAFPYVADPTSEVARAFGAKVTPEAYLFDAKGKLVYHGAIDDNEKVADVKTHYLKDAIAALVAGKSVATAETKGVGCTIKFAAEKAKS